LQIVDGRQRSGALALQIEIAAFQSAMLLKSEIKKGVTQRHTLDCSLLTVH
jgi:hypothetical protein